MPTTGPKHSGISAVRISLLLLAMTVTAGLASPWARPASPAAGDSSRVRVKVDGLACPFCAHGLEQNLKKIPGVIDLEILVDQGMASLTYASAHAINLDAIRKAVRQGGFTPTTMRATLTGVLEIDGDDLTLRMDKIPEGVLLAGGAALIRFRAGAAAGERVTISGEILERNMDGQELSSYTLAVEEYSAAATAVP